MRALVAALVLLVTSLVMGRAHAHGGRPASVELVATGPRDALVLVEGPLVPTVDECAVEPEVRGARSTWTVRCREALAGRRLGLAGLDEAGAVVLLRERNASDAARVEMVSRAAPSVMLGGPETTGELVSRFVRLGVAHVLGGLDHVLFLLALAWQVLARRRGGSRAARELAGVATLFTLAHGLTLCASGLGVLHVPVSAAEGAIAASLVLVALDLGRADRATGSARADAALVLAFGLVHGLGFASGLAEAGLPAGRRLIGLVAFNVGVEIGQAVVLAAALAVSLLAPRLARSAPLRATLARTSATASAYAVGIAGAWLFFSRVLSP